LKEHIQGLRTKRDHNFERNDTDTNKARTQPQSTDKDVH